MMNSVLGGRSSGGDHWRKRRLSGWLPALAGVVCAAVRAGAGGARRPRRGEPTNAAFPLENAGILLTMTDCAHENQVTADGIIDS